MRSCNVDLNLLYTLASVSVNQFAITVYVGGVLRYSVEEEKSGSHFYSTR